VERNFGGHGRSRQRQRPLAQVARDARLGANLAWHQPDPAASPVHERDVRRHDELRAALPLPTTSLDSGLVSQQLPYDHRILCSPIYSN